MVGVAQGLIGSLTTAAAASDPLPAGTILIFDKPDGGTSIPSGWSQLTDVSGTPIAGYAIKGGFNQAIFTSAGTNGVFDKRHLEANSTGAGSHALPAPFQNVTNVGQTPTPTTATYGFRATPATPAGISQHTHRVQDNPNGPFTYSAADVTAEQGVTAPLITNSVDENLIPPGAIIFSSSGSVFSGFSRKLWPALDAPQPVPTSTGLYTIASSGSANSVNKWPVNPTGLASPNFPGGSTPMRYIFEGPSVISPVAARYWMAKNPADPGSAFVLPTQLSGGIHYHGPTIGSGPAPPSGTLRTRTYIAQFGDGMMGHWHLSGGGSNYAPYFHWWKSFVHLLPCISTSAEAVQSGMIVMYSGSSAPTGWYVCDGNNGTPNLSDRFIGYNNAESGTNVVVGRSNVGTEDTLVPGTPGWPTTAGPTYNAPTTSVNWYVDSGTDPWPHTHVASSVRSSSFYTTGHPNAMPGTAHSHAFYTPKEAPPATPSRTVTTVSTEYLPKHITVLFIQKA